MKSHLFGSARYAVGIDFGTTKSAVAYVNVNADGHKTVRPVHIYKNTDFLPSCIYLNDIDDKRHFLLGRDAVRQYQKTGNDTRFFSQFKLDLGNEHLPRRYENLRVSPSILAARLIHDLLRIADTGVGELASGGRITSATITVPAGWSEVRKTQTEEAARAAGLNNISLLKEPTAALYFINYDEGLVNQVDQKIMVIDYGGGTCDVTICSTRSGSILRHPPEIIAEKMLDEKVGGREVDKALADLFISWASDEWKVKPEDLESYRRSLETIEAEEYKEDYVSWFNRRRQKGEPPIKVRLRWKNFPEFEKALTPTEFDPIVNPIVQRIDIPIKQVLQEAGITPTDIDQIFMVGGSSLLPSAKSIVENIFKDKAVKLPSEPRHAVSYGAALWQYYTTRSETNSENYFQPRRYSTLNLRHRKKLVWWKRLILMRQEKISEEDQTTLIKKGTSLLDAQNPKTLNFQVPEDNMDYLEIRIEESDIDGTANATQELYATTRLKFKNPVPKGTKLKITYYVDFEDRLVLQARVDRHDHDEEVTIVGRRSISEDRIAEIRALAAISDDED